MKFFSPLDCFQCMSLIVRLSTNEISICCFHPNTRSLTIRDRLIEKERRKGKEKKKLIIERKKSLSGVWNRPFIRGCVLPRIKPFLSLISRSSRKYSRTSLTSHGVDITGIGYVHSCLSDAYGSSCHGLLRYHGDLRLSSAVFSATVSSSTCPCARCVVAKSSRLGSMAGAQSAGPLLWRIMSAFHLDKASNENTRWKTAPDNRRIEISGSSHLYR